ncbi:hypothetical protein L207DRAFT_518359, partial [Hyaloscypha variabilis F]
MPPEARTTVASAFQENPRLYTFLYQILLVAITFFCAIAIQRYDPSSLPSSHPSDGNSTTPHICKHGAREDYLDLGPFTPYTPYIILCPSTPTFLFSIFTFVTGIYKFNTLHKVCVDVTGLYSGLVALFVLNADWRHIFSFLQLLAPFCWFLSVFVFVMDWMFWVCFPGAHGRLMEMKRAQREARRVEAEKRRKQRVGERGRDIEHGKVVEAQEEASEETPLTLGI